MSKYEHMKEEWEKLYSEGWTFAELEKEYGVDKKSLFKVIGSHTKKVNLDRKIDLTNKLVELANKHDLTYGDIEGVTGIPKSKICKLIKDKRIPLTEKMKSRYGSAWLKLHNDGYSILDIAEMFKTSTDTVSNVIKDLSADMKATRSRKYSTIAKSWKRMYENGFTIIEISEIFGVGDAVIRRYLNESNTKMRAKGTRRSEQEISEKRKLISLIKGE